MREYKIKWIIQRITAVLLIPLSFWFIYNCLLFSQMNYNELFIFFNTLTNSFLFLLTMIIVLIHAKIGCETILDDYIKSNSLKKNLKIIINILVYLSILSVILSVLRILLS